MDSMDSFFEQKHPKYQYNAKEMVAMSIFTSVSNFSVLPSLICVYKQGFFMQSYIGLFTMICSFMYHFMDSIPIERIILNEGQWHRLDNVGSIFCFVLLISYLTDFQDEKFELLLYYIQLLFIIILQEIGPWDINYTIGPIFLQLSIGLFVIILRWRLPQYKLKLFYQSLPFLFISVVCFYKGLDEYNDYLRIYHSCWHAFLGIFTFYIWQVQMDPKQVYTLTDIWFREPQIYKIDF